MIIKNVFTDKEITEIKDTISETLSKSKINEFKDQIQHDQNPYNQYVYLNQGRKDVYGIKFSEDISEKILGIANNITGKDLFLCGTQYTEYDGNLDGNPSLGMHHDGGDIDFLLDYQLESNFSWGIGIEKDVYEIEDNQLVLLRPVSNLHYRPKKTFAKDNYLKMIFFKFMEKSLERYKPINPSDEDLAIIESIYENYYKESK